MEVLHRKTNPALVISAIIWIFWGTLHIWVAAEGVHQYLTGGTKGLWNMVIGGSQVPRAAFKHTTSPVTAYAHAQLILNFCLDVGGYGALALIIAWMIWKKQSWAAYFIGVFVVGIADLSFFFSLVTAGVIEPNIPTISGPIVWFLACAIAPFGLPPLSKKSS
jgi:uncharacterized membrane protein (DUF2068 family)